MRSNTELEISKQVQTFESQWGLGFGYTKGSGRLVQSDYFIPDLSYYDSGESKREISLYCLPNRLAIVELNLLLLEAMLCTF